MNLRCQKIPFTIVKVADGINGVPGGPGAAGQNASTVFLTNENVTFAGNASGQVAAQTFTSTVVGYTGTTAVLPTVGTVTVPGGITVNVTTVGTGRLLTFTVANNTLLGGAGPQSGIINVPVTTPVVATLQISWSKVNTGAAGANAKSLSLNADAYQFLTTADGVTSPDWITLSVAKQNTVLLPTWTFLPAIDYYTASTGGTKNPATADTVYVRKADMGANTSVKVTAAIAADGLSDFTTLISIKEGLSALTTILTNESHTLPKATGGTPLNTGSGTIIRVLEGATELDYDATAGAGKWRIASATPSGGIAVGSYAAYTNLYATVGNHTTSGITGTSAYHYL